MSNSAEKIILGLSGGVDSSVSAHLLSNQGYAVECLFMKNWEEDDTEQYCSATEDLKDAEEVCRQLQLPLHTVNFSSEYWDHVFQHFLSEYQAGRTPNPDILCNREIKFKAFLDHARTLGANKIATGHYARCDERDGKFRLLKAIDLNKDQSYFLHLLNQEQLSTALFPLGNYTKPQVRKIATHLGLATQNKKDSTGICFIGERKFKSFLQQYLPAQPGEIITEDGQVIGQHDGLMYYTIGQRQGLQIGGQKSGSGEAWFVADKKLDTNQLIVVQGGDHPLLYRGSLTAQQTHWISGEAPENNSGLCAKTRYRQEDQDCEIELLENNRLLVNFTIPQRAITPGQSIVFYHRDICLGGAIIE